MLGDLDNKLKNSLSLVELGKEKENVDDEQKWIYLFIFFYFFYN